MANSNMHPLSPSERLILNGLKVKESTLGLTQTEIDRKIGLEARLRDSGLDADVSTEGKGFQKWGDGGGEKTTR